MKNSQRIGIWHDFLRDYNNLRAIAFASYVWQSCLTIEGTRIDLIGVQTVTLTFLQGTHPDGEELVLY